MTPNSEINSILNAEAINFSKHTSSIVMQSNDIWKIFFSCQIQYHKPANIGQSNDSHRFLLFRKFIKCRQIWQMWSVCHSFKWFFSIQQQSTTTPNLFAVWIHIELFRYFYFALVENSLKFSSLFLYKFLFNQKFSSNFFFYSSPR